MRKNIRLVITITVSLIFSLMAGCGVRAGATPDLSNDDKMMEDNINNIVNDNKLMQDNTEDSNKNGDDRSNDNVLDYNIDHTTNQEENAATDPLLEKVKNKKLADALNSDNPDQAIYDALSGTNWIAYGYKGMREEKLLSPEEYLVKYPNSAKNYKKAKIIFTNDGTATFDDGTSIFAQGKYEVKNKIIYFHDDKPVNEMEAEIQDGGVLAYTYCDLFYCYMIENNE